MRITILSLFLWSVNLVLGQTQIDLGTYSKPKAFNQRHNIYVNDQNIILYPLTETSWLQNVKFRMYQTAQINASTKFEDKKVRADEGIILEHYYSGDTSVEFAVYNEVVNLATFNCKYVVRFRNLNTMELMAPEKKLGSYKYHSAPDFKSVKFEKINKEYVLIVLNEHEKSITFFDEILEQTDKIEIKDPLLLQIKTNIIYSVQSNPDGSFDIITRFTSMDYSLESNSYLTLFSHVSNKHELTTIPLEIKDNQTDIKVFGEGYFFHDMNRGEISLAIHSIDLKSKQIGLCVVKWDRNGEFLSFNNTILDFQTIFKNHTEIQNHFKSKNISTEKIWGNYNFFGTISSIEKDDEQFILMKNPFYSPELASALYVLKLDKNGKMEWISPFLTAVQLKHPFFSGIPYFKDNQLHIVLADLTANAEGSAHANKTFSKKSGEIAIFDISINSNDGSIDENKQLDFVIPADKELNFMGIDNNLLLFEICKKGMVNYSFLNLN